MDVPGRLSLAPDDRAKPEHHKKHKGGVLSCVEVEGITNLKRDLCFGPRGEPLSVESLAYYNPLRVSYEYDDYAFWAGRQFPHSMRVYEGKTVVVQVQVEELEANAKPDSSLFVPPAGALAWDSCDGATPPRALDKPVPGYPKSAKDNRVQGTVSVYAVIEPGGRLQGLTVVRSAGSDLDLATLSVLARWRYQPALCSGKPIPTETVIDVAYSVRE
jgi:TonB family protein